MAVDLYQDDFSRLSDAEVLKAVEAFTRVLEPIANRPREGAVLDFKKEWSDSALHTVAGFAHAFGGLMLIGVSERDGRPDELVGVEARGELKTSIASAIATNISPAPSIQIAECSVPGQPIRKLAVVRVRQGSRIHYLTKKGEHPIYIRNEDQSVRADAAQLRSLVERKVQVSRSQSEMANRVNSLGNSAKLQRTAELEPGPIPTRLQILLAPIDHPGVALDTSIEQQFRNLIFNNFSSSNYGMNYEWEDQRWASEYEHRWFRPDNRHERVWRLTSEGDMTYAGQVRLRGDGGLSWSLGDAMADLLLFLAVARSLWKASGYYGEAQVVVDLIAHDLCLRPELIAQIQTRNTPDVHWSEHDLNSALRKSIVSPALSPQPTARATGIFNSGLPPEGATEMVSNLINQLLRSLGHGAELNMLRAAVRACFQYFP